MRPQTYEPVVNFENLGVVLLISIRRSETYLLDILGSGLGVEPQKNDTGGRHGCSYGSRA